MKKISLPSDLQGGPKK